MSAPDRYEQLGLYKLCPRPMDPVVEGGLFSTRQKLFAFGLGELELDRESINNVGHSVFGAVARQLQHWQHQ